MTSRLFICLLFLTVSINSFSQRFGVSLAPAVKIPVFMDDSITKGKPFVGVVSEVGYFPDDEGLFLWSFRAGYYKSFRDSALVWDNSSYYGSTRGKSGVHTSMLTFGLAYTFSVPQNFTSSSLYLNLMGSINYEAYFFKYTSTVNSPYDETPMAHRVSLGLEMAGYYDMDTYYLFGSILGTVSDKESDPAKQTASQFSAILKFGVVFFFD